MFIVGMGYWEHSQTSRPQAVSPQIPTFLQREELPSLFGQISQNQHESP